MCERCSELERENALLQTDLGNANHKLNVAWRAEQKAKNELKAGKDREPTDPEVQEVLEYWIGRLGKRTTTKIPPSGGRAKKVKWALHNGFTTGEIKLAIDGLARMPYVWDHGKYKKRMAYGTSKQRSDDITACLYDELAIARFQGYARQPEPEERSVPVPQSVLDRMRARVDRAVWAAEVWKDRAHQEDEYIAILEKRLVAAEAGRPMLSVAA